MFLVKHHPRARLRKRKREYSLLRAFADDALDVLVL